MDFSNYSHDGEDGVLTEQKESHWQPALRPDEDESDPRQQPDPAMNKESSAQSSQPHLSFAHQDDELSEPHSLGRLDPAWGIKRTDSAHILDAVHRSPSFPAPEPSQTIPSARLVRPSAVLKSSVPDQTVHSFSQTRPEAEDREDDDDDREALHNAHDAETLAQQEEQTTTQTPEFSSRYEEGMPLISADQESDPRLQPEQQHHHQEQPATLAFNTTEDDAAGGFFSQVGTASHSSVDKRPDFERKETADVLNGLGVRNAAPDSPPPVEAIHRESPPSEFAKEKDFAAAFGDDFTEDKDLAAAFAQNQNQNQDPEEDPWKAVMDEDDELLADDADDLLPDSDEELDLAPAPLPARPPQPAVPGQRAASYARSNSTYAPHQPTTSELTGFGPTTQQIGLPRQTQSPLNAFQPSQQRPNITNRAESFVDQSKGGYKSPYDLPMDLAPKKRVQPQRAAPPVNTAPPPPRTSSMNVEKQLQSPFSPNAPTFNQPVGVPPAAPVSGPSGDRASGIPVQPAQTASKRATSGFFEELPLAPRVRPSASARAPSVQTTGGPPRQSSMSNVNIVASPPQIQHPRPPQQQDPYAQFQLQQPAKLDPYANVPLQLAPPAHAPLAPAPPAAPSRYSPAPPGLQNGIRPSPSPRYSPAPPAQIGGARYSPAPPPQANGHNRYVSQPVPGTNLPFQPRTSSPLAQHRRSVDDSAEQPQGPRPNIQHSTSSSLPYHPPTNSLSPPRVNDPVKQEIVPPRRSQTQSPSRQITKPGVPARIALPPNRPASAFGQLSPTRTHPPLNILSPPRMTQHRPPVEELDYIRPTDGTEHDPLERFKGGPIFRYGFGGTVVTSFPVRTPRFSSATTKPQIKASSGEVKTRRVDTMLPPVEHISKFPGPLKGKAKKKDILTWLSTAVGTFQSEMMSNPGKRLEEKLFLWRIVQVLVESDGTLESPPAVEKISAILMPDVYAHDDATTSLRMDSATSGIYRPESFSAKSETVDPVAVDKLRKTLMKGKREDAVWQAVDNRLWSHALLLSSTLDKSVWKSVITEFVKQEVKTIGSNADSLCALYEVLGGNTEESIDQLVPPSARAGLQMVSRVEASGPTRNALDGLDRWRETLCLILNNRSTEDQRALIALGRLLTDYGRIEAAHICYLFARSLAGANMFGGADDPKIMVVLLGADHRNHPLSFHLDVDSVMLTEVYEFAVSTLAPGATGIQMPHLAAYKLQRAKELADAGMKTEAQAYCDVLEAGLKSSTKNSLYYNRAYQAELQDLSNRVRQIPVQSASWIAKPSIEKVSGSLLSKFSSFVTGEDSDADSKGSARDAAEAGPFANVSGSPTLSRNASQTDLYGSHPAAMQMTPAPAATAAGSRYAPNGMGSARSSSELARGRASLEYQRSPPTSSHGNEPPRSIYAPAIQSQHSAYSPNMMSPSATGYMANPYQPSPEPSMPSVAEESYPPTQQNSYEPQSDTYTSGITNGNSSPPVAPAFGGYTPDLSQQSQFTPAPTEPTPSSTFEPSTSSFEPQMNETGYGGYAPPEDTGYQPYAPEPDSPDNERSKPKKKSFMDDDDDYPRVSNNTSAPPAYTDEAARKKANDEAAAAAFRAAAEADAQRAKDQSSKKTGSGSWGFGLGGLFSAKKNESLDSAPSKSSGADKKVHRVHLGESKMKLYYDKEKGKWINPDNPDAGEKKVAPPPPRSSTGSVPPMAGPPRSVSQPAPPTGPLSRSGTPMSQAVDTGSEGGDSRPGTGGGLTGTSSAGFAATLPPGTAQSLGLGGSATPPGAAGLAPGSGPAVPSRPASALSNASGLDDLLGGPPTAGRKAGGRTASGARGKKRYVDVMAK